MKYTDLLKNPQNSIVSEFDRKTLQGVNPGKAAKSLAAKFDQSAEALLVLSSLLLDVRLRFHPIILEAIGLLEKMAFHFTPVLRDEAARKDLLSALKFAVHTANSFPKPSKVPRPKIGSLYQIPLRDGSFSYGRYVFDHPEQGYLFAVLAQVSPIQIGSDQLNFSDLRFPPVFVPLPFITREWIWQMIGNQPVEDFPFPLFVSGNSDENGKVHKWWLYDGAREVELGVHPPDHLLDAEQLVTWCASDLEERILTGYNPTNIRDAII